MDVSNFPASTRYVIQQVENGERIDIIFWQTLRDMEKIPRPLYESYHQAIKRIRSEEMLKGQAFGL